MRPAGAVVPRVQCASYKPERREAEVRGQTDDAAVEGD